MALLTPFVAQNGSYPASEHRVLVDMLPGVGPLRFADLVVSERGSGPNMSVDVAPGVAVVPNEVAGRGRYLCSSTAVENVSIAAAPGAGSSRIDLVVASVSDTEYGDGSDAWSISVVTGTPSSSPSVPSVPDGAIVLAQVAVGAEVAAITDSNITDRRSFAGCVVPVGGGGLPSAGHEGQLAVTGAGAVSVRAGGVWVPQVSASLFGQVEAAIASFAVPASTVTVTSSTLTLPDPGAAMVSLYASFTGRHAGSGAVALWCEVSWDGSTWTGPGLRTNQQNRDDPNHPSATAVDLRVTGTPTAAPRVRLRASRSGGSASTLVGAFGVTMQPGV